MTFGKPEIAKLSRSLGFEACRFTSTKLAVVTGSHLRKFVELGRHGEMAWMAETLDRRVSPEAMWPRAKTAIVLGMNYGPDHDPLDSLKERKRAVISVYAQNRDYHEIIKGRLKQIAQKIASQNACQVKVFVDTAPLMEKPLAEKAGLGWQGKHTNLVSRELGSWLFLGVILTDMDIAADEAEIDHCGSCTSCIDICPTDAFPAPYQLDARRCISYLTIEHSGLIPHEFRKPIGNRIYGCDDCLAVCPWNKFAAVASEAKLQARDDLKSPLLKELVQLDDTAFRKHFSGSPIKRIGRNRFIRNVLIAIGNSAEPTLIEHVQENLTAADARIRGAAVWALAELASKDAFLASRKRHIGNENDASVLDEWALGLNEDSHIG